MHDMESLHHPVCLDPIYADPENSWSGFNELRNNGLLCDFTLVSGEARFPVHRIIMAAHSCYFRSMFTSEMKESYQDVVELPDVSADCLLTIIDFIYKRQLNVNLENVWTVMTVANRLQILGLDDLCSLHIRQLIDHESCIRVMLAARSYGFDSLYSAAREILLRDFVRISISSQDFVEQLDLDDVIGLLSDDSLNVTSEEITWDAVVRWIEYKYSERAPHIVSLLPHIRLAQLDLDLYVTRVGSYLKTVPVIGDNTEKMQKLCNEYFTLLEKTGTSPMDLSHPLKKPRVPRDVLFVIGGWSGGSPVAYIETYDCRAERWYSHPLLEDASPRAYHGMVLLDNVIYVIGGFDGTAYYSDVRKFDPTASPNKNWTPAAPMYTSRCYLSAAVMDGHIYACGGYDGTRRLGTVEQYSPLDNQWTMKGSMNHNRSDAAIDSLQGRLYVVGGFNGDECLASAEFYSPQTDQWTLLEPMTSPRSGVSVLNHQGYLYAFGGFDGTHRLASCERYNSKTRLWEVTQPMLAARSNFAVAVLEENIYVIGGFDGHSTISHVECFRSEKNCWQNVTEMNVNRSALKACVLSYLPNTKTFTYHGHAVDTDSLMTSDDAHMMTECGDI